MKQNNHCNLRILPVLLLAWMVSGCATPIDMPQGRSKGYASVRLMQPKGAAAKGMEQLPEANAMIQNAIAAEFNVRNIEIKAADADLVVAYMLLFQDKVQTTQLDDYFGYRTDAAAIASKAHLKGNENRNNPEDVVKGALVIDVLRASDNQLIYRKYTTRDILENASTAERRERIDQAVKEILTPFFR